MSDTLNDLQRKPFLTEEQRKRPILDVLEELLGPVPSDEADKVPHDGSLNHDHYLYGAPKKQP